MFAYLVVVSTEVVLPSRKLHTYSAVADSNTTDCDKVVTWYFLHEYEES